MKCVICEKRQAEIGCNVCMLCTLEEFYKERADKQRETMYIAVDFDGTMVDHCYPEIGKPVPGALVFCRKFMEQGHQIILWTMRSGKELEEAADYMRSNGIELFGINTNPTQHTWTESPKAYAHLYIDDAAAGTPLLNIDGYNRPCVNWYKLFTKDGQPA